MRSGQRKRGLLWQPPRAWGLWIGMSKCLHQEKLNGERLGVTLCPMLAFQTFPSHSMRMPRALVRR